MLVGGNVLWKTEKDSVWRNVSKILQILHKVKYKLTIEIFYILKLEAMKR